MIAVIFEVWPSADGRQEYLDLAASLRPLLDNIEGFISIERFSSLSAPGKVLSLSFFPRRGGAGAVAAAGGAPRGAVGGPAGRV